MQLTAFYHSSFQFTAFLRWSIRTHWTTATHIPTWLINSTNSTMHACRCSSNHRWLWTRGHSSLLLCCLDFVLIETPFWCWRKYLSMSMQASASSSLPPSIPPQTPTTAIATTPTKDKLKKFEKSTLRSHTDTKRTDSKTGSEVYSRKV